MKITEKHSKLGGKYQIGSQFQPAVPKKSMFQALMAKLKVAKNLVSSNPNIEDGY
jgi:hypothetical protein